uniref:Uncharacterized protein n=1 Tax=Lepeophtheirus salmonis TaxID=72036 RepID=A0A0K2V1V8_LEPSM
MASIASNEIDLTMTHPEYFPYPIQSRSYFYPLAMTPEPLKTQRSCGNSVRRFLYC